MTLSFFINPSDELPIYRQIMRQILEGISTGRLKGGDKLKSHRELSEQLIVAPLTVKKAYEELETLGYIETQRGRGTFVCDKLPKIHRSEHLDQLDQAARKLLSVAYLGGIRLSEVIKVLRELDEEMTSSGKEEREKA